MNVGRVKSVVKQASLALGVYRPARYINDYLTNRAARARLNLDKEFFSGLIAQESLCFDVGANIGEKTFALLSAGARVIAFEPIPFCVEELAARCKRYSQQLEICQKALGEAEGRATIYVNSVHPNMSSFVSEWEGESKYELEVEIVTLDMAIRQYGRPCYCKIDVEGWETQVLSGLTHPLPLISFEFHLSTAGIESARRCIAYLSSLGKGGALVNLTPAETLAFKYPEWMEPTEFLERFPDEFFGLRDYRYGDIWVRTN